MKKVLLTGANGQLGWEIQRTLPDNVQLIALSRAELDIADAESVDSCFQEYCPDTVINAAAYTAVDKAETDRESAFNINALGAENLAKACSEHNAFLFHVSTDFVFDGSANMPYTTDIEPSPIGVYGETKLIGEQKIRAILPEQSAIVRTAWVYSSHGANFVKSMLRLMSEKPQLGIVIDQVGTPTWAKGLAKVAWEVSQKRISGTYHWSDLGVTSWYDFAIAIQELGLEKDILKQAIPIQPIPSSAYPTPARRPHYSVLDKQPLIEQLNLQASHWRSHLASMLDEIKNEKD